MALTGADILAIEDRKQDSVEVPEWGGITVYVRSMGAIERANYEMRLMDLKDETLATRMWQIKVGLVVLCACDENMVRLFTDDQFNAVAQKSADAIDRIFDVINKLNLVTQNEVDQEQGN